MAKAKKRATKAEAEAAKKVKEAEAAKGAEVAKKIQEAEAAGKVPVTADGAKAVFTKWLERGEVIAVYQNKAMDSATFGTWMFMPVPWEALPRMTVGHSHAPDTRFGPGWKFLLERTETALDAFEFIEG